MIIFHKRVVSLSEATLRRFSLRARQAVGLKGPVNLLLTSSAAMRTLNRQFRGKDVATDVLSFPFPSLPHSQPARTAGDIAISVDIAAQNAGKLGHSTAEEVKILVLHGILHLAGFDHERDNGEMARKEARLRRTLQLPLALIERNESEGSRSPGNKRLRQKADRAGARRTA